MVGDDHPGLLADRPEAVVGGIGRRAEAGRRLDRRRPHGDDPGTQGDAALELDGGSLRVHEGEHRCREDPIVVGVAPLVVDPAVERAEHRAQCGRIVPEQLLDAEREGWEHDDALDALGVEDGQPRPTGAVLGAGGLHLADHRPSPLTLGGLAPEVLGERTGLGHRGEGRVLDHPEDLVADRQDATAAVVGGPGEGIGELGRQVPGEGVVILVVVLVSVVEGVVDTGRCLGWHGCSLVLLAIAEERTVRDSILEHPHSGMASGNGYGYAIHGRVGTRDGGQEVVTERQGEGRSTSAGIAQPGGDPRGREVPRRDRGPGRPEHAGAGSGAQLRRHQHLLVLPLQGRARHGAHQQGRSGDVPRAAAHRRGQLGRRALRLLRRLPRTAQRRPRSTERSSPTAPSPSTRTAPWHPRCSDGSRPAWRS